MATAEKMTSWKGHASVKGSSETLRMILLSFSAIGITFTWGFEMTYCTPYLLNLGLTKSSTSLVWIAGPISGLIVQPIVGAIADQSTSKWGRRRPLMVIGSLIAAAHVLLLGFTREFVGLFLAESDFASRVTVILAVYSIWVIDFAINASMSCSRSLVVDVLPINKQQSGAAWYSRLAACGHLLAYSAGSLDLVSIFGSAAGDSQFKQLAVVAVFAMLSTCALTCWAVTEKVLVSAKGEEGVGAAIGTLWNTLRHLPPRVQAICWAHFWAWIGWFPFNFYGTTWVGETYFRYDVPPEERNSRDALSEIGRIGSTSLVIYSIITFLGSFLLPMLVRSPQDHDYTPRPPRSIAGVLERVERLKPDLLTAWVWGHLGFSTAMFMAPFARSYQFATVLVAICGLPWAMTQWAPPTFLGIEVNRLSGVDTLPTQRVPSPAHSSQGLLTPQQAQAATSESQSHLSPSLFRSSSYFSLSSAQSQTPSSASPPPSSPTGELSGIYFGILNIYTTIPQFIGAVMSGVVFAVLDPGKSPELSDDVDAADPEHGEGPNAIGVALFIGAACTLVSAYNTRKLRYID